MIFDKRNNILITCFLVLLFISYKLAITKTIDQRSRYISLKKEQLIMAELPKQLSMLKARQVYYDSILTKYQLGKTSLQNKLLEFLSTYAKENKLVIKDFMEPHIIIQENELILKTFSFTIEGDYEAIQNLIYTIEQKTRFGEVIHLEFQKGKNRKTRKDYLNATIMIRSYD